MAKPKLCEIIAVVSGKKGEVEKAVTDHYHKFQKEELFDGLSRSYRPRKEDGEVLPAESKQPQLRATDLITDACKKWRELFDLTLTLDAGNCVAKGDIIVKDKLILSQVPVTTLLFLEKQLANVHAFVSKLPTPSASENWKHDSQQDMLASDVRGTVRTKKTQKPLVLFPATPEHPAQTQLITEDEVAGDWSQILFTTRIPSSKKNEMLERVTELQDAVKIARERANGVEVDKHKMGEAVLKHVFGDLASK